MFYLPSFLFCLPEPIRARTTPWRRPSEEFHSASHRTAPTDTTKTAAAAAAAAVKDRITDMNRSTLPRPQFYSNVLSSLAHRLSSTADWTALLANAAAILFNDLKETYGDQSVNWVGFYMNRPVSLIPSSSSSSFVCPPFILVLGPFQGRAAVPLIAHGRGVCGTAAVECRSQLVPDVHSHPNHIACDSRSQSECVLPLMRAGRLLGVLDIDCPLVGGLGEEDREGLQSVADWLSHHADWCDEFHPVRLTEAQLIDEPVCELGDSKKNHTSNDAHRQAEHSSAASHGMDSYPNSHSETK